MVEPYPHIKMGVRDDSIATILETEVLPLDKPLYMGRFQKGPIGKPVWCPSYTYACQVFGTETFNKRSKFWSENSYFLMKTLVANGAFLMRVAEEKAVESKIVLECGVKKADVPQWQRNTITGQFILNDDGSHVGIDSTGASLYDANGERRVLSAEDIAKMDENDRYVYSVCTDTRVVLGKKYFARKYKQYAYTPYVEPTAEKDMVLYCGDPTKEMNIKEYTSEEITPEIIAKEYVFRMSVEADRWIAVPPTSTVDPTETYFKIEDGEWVEVDQATFPEDGSGHKVFPTDYQVYVKNMVPDPIEGDPTHKRQLDVGEYLPVTNFDNLDPTIKYYTLGFTVWTGKIFNKGEDIPEINTWYTRAPLFSKGYAWFEMGALIGEDNFKPGDQIESDGSIYHYVDGSEIPVYVGNEGQLYTQGAALVEGSPVPQATIPGLELVWRAVIRNAADDRPLDSADPSQSNGYTWYPMLSALTDSAGTWGNSFGFRFYYDKTNNTIAGVVQSCAVKYSISPVELKEDATIPTAIVDAYGESTVVGTIKDGVVDPTTDLEITLKKLIPSKYNGTHELPVDIAIIDENFKVVGEQVVAAELECYDAIKDLYKDLADGTSGYWAKDPDTKQPIVRTFIDDLVGVGNDPQSITEIEDYGHMANCVSCVAADKAPYFASRVVGTFDEAANAETKIPDVVDLNDEAAFYLKGGTDGDIRDCAIESYIRQSIDACVAGTHDYLIDYLRCPYNSVVDTGVSLKTKKSYLDFMGVRDNLTVFLTPQQLWKNEDGTTPPQLSRYEDESVGASLRSYGLLMREDIENGTEANRCIIFLASGVNSDHDYANDGLCASTLWVALKNAEYYHGTKIVDEPVERPNSEITCYDGGMTWTAASEETRSRCWNAGLNYAQYAEQTVIHYASVRSIYRYDTSVLCDMGTVRAVTFCKDIIRKEWAIWAGSKRKAETLNSKINQALNSKINAMLNNKYTATAKVYQTDEDKKYGYVRHVDLELESPAQNRVWLATIICKREGFDPNAEEE